jgi:hypothetical protein
MSTAILFGIVAVFFFPVAVRFLRRGPVPPPTLPPAGGHGVISVLPARAIQRKGRRA